MSAAAPTNIRAGDLRRSFVEARRLIDAGRSAEALELMKAAAAQAPTSSEAHFLLAVAQRNLKRAAESEESALLAVELDPRNAAAAHFLGALMAEKQDYGRSLAWLREAARLAPDVARHRRDLGVVAMFVGDRKTAQENLLRAAELDPLADRALYTLTRLTPMAAGTKESRRLMKLLRDVESQADNLAPEVRAQLFYALAKAHEDLGKSREAFGYMMRAADLKNAAATLKMEEVESLADRVIATFDRALFQRLAGQGAPSPRPVFIVGMPRSGTTLVEQILAAHPRVCGAGETNALMNVVSKTRGKTGALFPEWVSTLNGFDCQTLASAYLKALPAGKGAEIRTTDKRLDNVFFLGLAAAILPGASLIHCRRDPRDVGFSCLALMFSDGQEWSYSLEGIGRFWRVHQRLMAHWRSVLPAGKLLDIEYERLVADPEPWSRRLVEHVGLEWDDSCLSPHRADRVVTSASMAQVREPIYDRSIGRWKPFARELEPMFEAMGLEAE